MGETGAIERWRPVKLHKKAPIIVSDLRKMYKNKEKTRKNACFFCNLALIINPIQRAILIE